MSSSLNEELDLTFEHILKLTKDKTDIDFIDAILNDSVEKHVHSKTNLTLLFSAIEMNRYYLVEKLILRGNSNITDLTSQGDILLHLMCHCDSTNWYLEAMPKIFENIDFNVQNKSGGTILHSAASNFNGSYFSFLLNHKDFNPNIHLNIQNKLGNTCLVGLVILDRLNDLKKCIALNFNSIFIKNNKKKNILQVAESFQNHEIINYLYPLFDCKAFDNSCEFKLFDYVKIKSTNQTGIVLSLQENQKDCNFVTIVFNNPDISDIFIKNVIKTDVDILPKKELNESGDFIYDASKIKKGQLICNDHGNKFFVIDVQEELFVARSIQSEYSTHYHHKLVPFQKFFWFA